MEVVFESKNLLHYTFVELKNFQTLILIPFYSFTYLVPAPVRSYAGKYEVQKNELTNLLQDHCLRPL
jgi:hypothetical protein